MRLSRSSGPQRARLGTLLSLLPALVAFWALAGCQKTPERSPDPRAVTSASSADNSSVTSLPRLLDLGAGKCIPCKKMAPILDELKEEFDGSLEVVFIDVWQDKEAAKKFGIEAIPVQIFFDSSGKELFRHEGFFAKEEILAKWKELGFEFKSKRTPSTNTGP